MDVLLAFSIGMGMWFGFMRYFGELFRGAFTDNPASKGKSEPKDEPKTKRKNDDYASFEELLNE